MLSLEADSFDSTCAAMGPFTPERSKREESDLNVIQTTATVASPIKTNTGTTVFIGSDRLHHNHLSSTNIVTGNRLLNESRFGLVSFSCRNFEAFACESLLVRR